MNWQERREQEYWEELAPKEALYEKIKAKLDAAEQAHVAELRERRLAGDERAYYGHDLMSAIGRAERRIAIDKAAEYLAGARNGNLFSALGYLIDAAVEADIPADKIRRALVRAAEATDHSELEKRVARWKAGEE